YVFVRRHCLQQSLRLRFGQVVRLDSVSSGAGCKDSRPRTSCLAGAGAVLVGRSGSRDGLLDRSGKLEETDQPDAFQRLAKQPAGRQRRLLRRQQRGDRPGHNHTGCPAARLESNVDSARAKAPDGTRGVVTREKAKPGVAIPTTPASPSTRTIPPKSRSKIVV